MQGARLDVGPLLDGGCVRSPWGPPACSGSAATLVTLLGSTSVQLVLFFFRADDRKRAWHGTVASKVVCGVAPMASQDGTATAQHPCYIPIAPYLASGS
jgi:hypothetical protein